MDKVHDITHEHDHIAVSLELFSSKYTIPLTCHTSNKNDCENTKKQCTPTALHLEHLNNVSGPYIPPVYNLEFRDQDFREPTELSYTADLPMHTPPNNSNDSNVLHKFCSSHSIALISGHCAADMLRRRLHDRVLIYCFLVRSQNCTKKKRTPASSCLSVCRSTWNNSAPTGGIFMKFDVLGFFENLSRKLKFH